LVWPSKLAMLPRAARFHHDIIEVAERTEQPYGRKAGLIACIGCTVSLIDYTTKIASFSSLSAIGHYLIVVIDGLAVRAQGLNDFLLAHNRTNGDVFCGWIGGPGGLNFNTEAISLWLLMPKESEFFSARFAKWEYQCAGCAATSGGMYVDLIPSGRSRPAVYSAEITWSTLFRNIEQLTGFWGRNRKNFGQIVPAGQSPRPAPAEISTQGRRA